MASNKVKFTSPFGVAKYPHISSPDTKGKFADGKYKTKLIMALDDDAATRFMAVIDEAARALHGPKGDKLYKPYEVDEDAGQVTFVFKTKYAPAIFDSRNNAAKGVNIGGGSVIRLMGNIVEFDKGITAQFNQVQIKELNGFGASAFDEVEDGYAFEPDDGDSSGFSDVSDDSSSEGGNASRSALDI